MIRATFFKRDNKQGGYLIRGHAGYAHRGYDIVCAAVSALGQGTEIGLRHGNIALKRYVNPQKGIMYVAAFPAGKEQERLTEILLGALRESLNAISAQYNGFLLVDHAGK